MINLNGIWLKPEDVVAVLPVDTEVHISLTNGATYTLPGEMGVDVQLTAAKMVDALRLAGYTAVTPAVPLPPTTPQDFLQQMEGLRQTPLGHPDEPEGSFQEFSQINGVTPETARDAANEKWYADGWRDALKEAKLQVLNGTLDIFLEETLANAPAQGVDLKAELSHPFDLPGDSSWADDHEIALLGEQATLADVVSQYTVPTPNADHSTDDPYPGNPATGTPDLQDGKITLPYDEYLAVVEAARRDGSTETRQTTERWLAKATSEILVEAGGSPPNNYTFAKSLLKRIGFEVTP